MTRTEHLEVLDLTPEQHATLTRLAALGAMLVGSVAAENDACQETRESGVARCVALEIMQRENMGAAQYDKMVDLVLGSVAAMALSHDPDEFRANGLM